MIPRKRERRARARALQALYASDVRGGDDIDRVASQVFDDLSVERAERALAESLVDTVVTQRAAIDDVLSAATWNWRIERLGAIERTILRLGVAELAAAKTPPRVVLQEMVRLAERFGGLESARFVNGVLDAVARGMGRL